MASVYFAGSQNSLPDRDGSSLYGVSMAAVWASTTPSSIVFDCATGNPGIVIGVADMFDGVDSIRGKARWIEEVCNIKAEAELAVLSQLVIEIKEFEISAGAVHPDEPILICLVHSKPQSGEPFFARGFRHQLRHQIAGSFLRAPVASPFSSRTILPLVGSGVSLLIPANCSALLFAQELWPSKAER